jgi:hypothetical protein
MGLIDFKLVKAPFLKLIKEVPLEVPPSGYMISGGYIPYSQSFYLCSI